MCGIVGLIQEQPIEEKVLSSACDRLAHRGPDDRGIWISPDGTVGLAQRRLSIIDLSPLGHQPMTTGEGRHWITFNGEIYNFAALRQELERSGHRFRSRTDTEVILAAYAQWGKSCVEHLQGMFAFAIWDLSTKTLFAARDRLGIKPFYYYWDGRRFAFASELKAIEDLPGLDLRVDETALYDFLTYIYVPTPKTPYLQVRKLAAGHTLTLRGDRLDLGRYWEVDFHPVPVRSEEDAVEGVQHHLDQAVASHLIADVPVGCLLSGGIDSSAVAAYAQDHLKEPLHTFAIGFDAADSETPYARQMAEYLGTRHTEEIVSLASAAALAGRVPGIYDEPFGDSSAIPTLVVSEVARRSVKVALSGDGGDEVFGGYSWYTRHLRRSRFPAVPHLFREILPGWLEKTSLSGLRGVPTLIDGLRPDLERHVAIMGGFTKAQKRLVLRPEVMRHYATYNDLWYFDQHWDQSLDLMSRLQCLDLKTYLVDDILVKVDRVSMAVALEVRPPLLDHRLVEFVARLPAQVRTPGGSLKSIFKRALQGKLPASILQRGKKGFSIPLSQWIGGLTREESGRGVTPTQSWLLQQLHSWREGHAAAPGHSLVQPEWQ